MSEDDGVTPEDEPSTDDAPTNGVDDAAADSDTPTHARARRIEPDDEEADDDAEDDDAPAAEPIPGIGLRRGPLVAIAAAVVLVIVVAIVFTSRRGADTVAAVNTTMAPGTLGTRPPGTVGTVVPTLPEDGVTIPTITTPPRQPDPLPGPPFSTVTPKREGQLPVFATPNNVATTFLPNPRQIGNDRNATVPLTLLVKRIVDPNWFEVYLPIRPNGSAGYVRASDVTVAIHNFHIEVRLSQFNIKAFDGNRPILDAPIGVATDNTPTPGGTYYTTELIKLPDKNGPYGPFAYGLSGYSEVLQTFNGGVGQLGIHGTNQPWAIGAKVSHGCIRLRNEDITKLSAILPLGVPVQIYP